MSSFGQWLKWSLGPLQGVVTGLRSYRFFTALEKRPTKALKWAAKRRSLLSLQQVDTGFSPLHVAVNKADLELMKAIVARKDYSDYVNLQNNQKQWSPLHCAVRSGNLEVLDLLLSSKPNVFLRTSEGCSPLHIAAGHGLLEVVKKLVAAGMMVDEADSGNLWTPLHYAAMNGQLELTKWLVANGAKPGSVDKAEFTPMYLSILHGQMSTFQFLYQYRDSFKSKAKLKPVHLAAQAPAAEILSYLHSKKHNLSEIDSADSEAQPIHYAAYGRSTACIQYLIDNGVDINARDKSGSTALHMAVINQDIDSVHLLMFNGADSEIVNEKGLTPMDIAESLQNVKLTMLMRRSKSSHRID